MSYLALENRVKCIPKALYDAINSDNEKSARHRSFLFPNGYSGMNRQLLVSEASSVWKTGKTFATEHTSALPNSACLCFI
jgi:hypothetical protein